MVRRLATPGDGPRRSWVHPVLLVLAGYFLVHTLLRAALGGSLELDEAEQILLSQRFQWGYSSQPPLYAWLQMALFVPLGRSILALAVLKNALLFLTYGFVFLSALELLREERRAMLATLALLFIPSFAWEAQRDLTNTVLAVTMAALTLLAVLRLRKHNTVGNYVLLGTSLAGGILSKYNFALYASALVVTLLAESAGRRAVLDRRFLITLGLMAALLTPHLAWILEHREFLEEVAGREFSSGAAIGPFRILGKLAVAVLSAMGLLILLWGLFFIRFPHPFRRDASSARRFLSRYLIAILLLTAAAALLTGAQTVKVRWMIPLLLPAPLLLFACLPDTALSERRCRGYVLLAGLAGLAVILITAFRVLGSGMIDQTTDLNYPFPEFTQRLEAEGFSGGLIVASRSHIAGNLLYRYGEGSAAIVPHVLVHADRPGRAPVLVAWNARKTEHPPAELLSLLKEQTGITAHAGLSRFLTAAYHHTPGSEARLGYMIFPAD